MGSEHTFRWEHQRDDGDRMESGLLWAGKRSYPARFHRHSMHEDIPDSSDFLQRFPDYRFETRQSWVHLENRWQLSVIWGDATYSDNTHSIRIDMERRPFVEEPVTVEVGVLMPFPIEKPAQEFDLPSFGKTELPAYDTTLWGDPLAYVSVPEFHRVADLVMMLPTDIDVPEGEWDSAEGFCDFLITAGMAKAL